MKRISTNRVASRIIFAEVVYKSIVFRGRGYSFFLNASKIVGR